MRHEVAIACLRILNAQIVYVVVIHAIGAWVECTLEKGLRYAGGWNGFGVKTRGIAIGVRLCALVSSTLHSFLKVNTAI